MKCPGCGNKRHFTLEGVFWAGGSIDLKDGITEVMVHMEERIAEAWHDSQLVQLGQYVICDKCEHSGPVSEFGGFPKNFSTYVYEHTGKKGG